MAVKKEKNYIWLAITVDPYDTIVEQEVHYSEQDARDTCATHIFKVERKGPVVVNID